MITRTIPIMLCAACATSYQPSGLLGGYSETRLRPDTVTVSFDGNGYTSSQRATDFAMLRAAQLTGEAGYPFFMVASQEAGSSSSLYVAPQTHTLRGDTLHSSGGMVIPINKPSSSMTIVMLSDDADGAAYRARYVRESIVEKYGLPPHLEPESSLWALLEVATCVTSVALLGSGDSMQIVVGAGVGAGCVASLVVDALDIETGSGD